MRTKTDKRELEYVKVQELTPYARNSRTHTQAQVKMIAASIREFGFTNPVLIDQDNGIIAGHGRVLAAEHLSIPEVPCIRLGYLTESEKRAYVIADNRIAEVGSAWDLDMLKLEAEELGLTDKWELGDILSKLEEDDKEEEEQGEVKFSEIMDESNNYVVLVFRNDIDWLSAMSHFNLSTKYARRANGKEWSAGIGRIIDGAAYLDSLREKGANQ